MVNNKFYVVKDDLVAAGPFETVSDAESAAHELRETQKLLLLTSRRVLKLFKKGVPLNLSDYSIVCVVKECNNV